MKNPPKPNKTDRINKARMRDPSKLSTADLRDVVLRIQQVLWPAGDVDHNWSPDTLDEISSTIINAGLGPDFKSND